MDEGRFGVVVMLDALGFKGIWNHYDPALILAKMKTLQRAFDSYPDDPNGKQGDYIRRSQCISDTIVVGVWPRESGSIRVAMQLASSIVRSMTFTALQDPVPLAYRGVMTVGPFMMDDRIILGKAVDEAAALMELAEAAIVWLSPSAMAELNGQHDRSIGNKYSVPLKGGASYETTALRPGVMKVYGAEKFVQHKAAALATFDRKPEDLSVQIKRQNTARFFDAWIAWRDTVGAPPSIGDFL